MQSISSISSNMFSIPTLNGSKFWECKYDLAFREDRPTISDSSTDQYRSKLEHWDISNRTILMLIKHSIPSVFRGIVSDEVVLAKDYLVALEKSFAKNDKAETITLLADLFSMRCQGMGSIREYILRMSNTASKLKALGLSLADDFLVCLVLSHGPG